MLFSGKNKTLLAQQAARIEELESALADSQSAQLAAQNARDSAIAEQATLHSKVELAEGMRRSVAWCVAQGLDLSPARPPA